MKILKYILILITIIFINKSIACNTQFKVEYVKNYDGDTITVNISNIHPFFGKNMSVRVRGIDTPEIRGKCKKEKALALEAKEIVMLFLTNCDTIILKNIKKGKYFRIVADVCFDGMSLSKTLLDMGYGVVYNGGKKTKDWCKEK